MNETENISKENDIIKIVSTGKTDFFNDILTDYKKSNAPFYYINAEDDFILRCMIKPDFKNTYDAGSLLIFQNEDKWIKFAFENTDLGYPSVVSVVTDGKSDDSNGERIAADKIYLQVVRKGDNWCLHYSLDNKSWKMVRYFSLIMDKKIKAGISAQSPLGDGCAVEFHNLELLKNDYSNIRKAE